MESNVTAIELQGIVRNRTKIGVEDGQADDILNLRFKDGCWRTSGSGRKMNWDFQQGHDYFDDYKYFFIHTNIYRHLLGVNKNDNKLYWLGDIDSDGITFTEHTGGVKALTTITGDATITQAGHLITVIDEADNFEFLVFHTSEDKYIKVEVNENGKQTDRGIYPFGQVHFNLYSPNDENHLIDISNDVPTPSTDGAADLNTGSTYYSTCKDAIKKKNLFGQPFLIICALKLYDGSYVFTSPPSLLYPRQKIVELSYTNQQLTFAPVIKHHEDAPDYFGQQFIYQNYATLAFVDSRFQYHNKVSECTNRDLNLSNIYDDEYIFSFINSYFANSTKYKLHIAGSNICINVDKNIFSILNNNVFQSLSIFVTQEVDIYKTIEEGILDGERYFLQVHYPEDSMQRDYVTYQFKLRDREHIIYDLLHSPFYLLREYNKNNIIELLSNPIIDLSYPQYDGLLEKLVQQDQLTIESTSRLTYLPKYSYQYNGRLHIADYKTRQFHGYPIDLFMLNNHSVKLSEGSKFKGILNNLADNNDQYLQYAKKEYRYVNYTEQDAQDFLSTARESGDVLAQVIVEIETDKGTQKVVRYIAPEDTNIAAGIGNYFEDLSPLLTFPDIRAKKMSIALMYYEDGQFVNYGEKTFSLQPHPLYNFAYYIDPDLRPISIDDMAMHNQPDTIRDFNENFHRSIYNTLVAEQNTEEHFPNGLKVSATDNPMIFPVENTYRIGNSRILAMCSNTIAVGTGQTGAAPLYIFCEDGVYALFVDASGQMTYTNARALARDVINNARSVTPIDAGVVFTTDRGLMMIAGEQVQEIGQPAEGDVLQFANENSTNYIKLARGAFTHLKLADLPSALCDTMDFLTYLKGSIINYNHNERELMVSNPDKNYSYILDSAGNWTRRDYSATAYVNNYPTSYRLDKNGYFYKVDEEGNNNTSLEHRKEANNKFFYLSNIIKLGSIGFKQAYRFVVRGYFNAIQDKVIGCYIFGSYDGRKWAMLGGNERAGTFTDIGCNIEHTDVKFLRICLAGQLQGDSRINYMEISHAPSELNTKIR